MKPLQHQQPIVILSIVATTNNMFTKKIKWCLHEEYDMRTCQYFLTQSVGEFPTFFFLPFQSNKRMSSTSSKCTRHQGPKRKKCKIHYVKLSPQIEQSLSCWFCFCTYKTKFFYEPLFLRTCQYYWLENRQRVFNQKGASSGRWDWERRAHESQHCYRIASNKGVNEMLCHSWKMDLPWMSTPHHVLLGH